MIIDNLSTKIDLVLDFLQIYIDSFQEETEFQILKLLPKQIILFLLTMLRSSPLLTYTKSLCYFLLDLIKIIVRSLFGIYS